MYDRTLAATESKSETESKLPLTFQLCGKIWHRSLILRDMETGSEWSQILGEAMAGKLKGQKLTVLPSDLVTWGSWKQTHAATTVLKMSRTSEDFVKEMYVKPDQFVIGLETKGNFFHTSLPTKLKYPLQNIEAASLPLLITFNEKTTSTLLYSRKIDGRVLTFERLDHETFRDLETNSTWNRSTGKAIDGVMKGKTLSPHVSFPSFLNAWKVFHPQSVDIAK